MLTSDPEGVDQQYADAHPSRRRSGVALAIAVSLVPVVLAALVALSFVVPLSIRVGDHRLYAGPMYGIRRFEQLKYDYSGTILIPGDGIHLFEQRGRRVLSIGSRPWTYEISWR